MKFKINNDEWIIELKGKEELLDLYKTQYDEDASFCFGVTERAQHFIWINANMPLEQQIKTLKHELAHCYIWEYGLYEVPNFNEEMACDLVSRSNDFINEIVEKYKKESKNE